MGEHKERVIERILRQEFGEPFGRIEAPILSPRLIAETPFKVAGKLIEVLLKRISLARHPQAEPQNPKV